MKDLKTNFWAQLALSIVLYVPMWYTYQMTYIISDDDVAIELDQETGLKYAAPGWHWKENIDNKIVRYSATQTITYKDNNESI